MQGAVPPHGVLPPPNPKKNKESSTYSWQERPYSCDVGVLFPSLTNAFSCHEFLDVSLFFLNGGWGGGSLPCGGRRGTAPCIRQYSDRFFVYYSYFAPQFLWYLSCSLLLSGPNLSLMGEGGFWTIKPTYLYCRWWEKFKNTNISAICLAERLEKITTFYCNRFDKMS